MPEFAEFSTPRERLTPLTALGLIVREASRDDLPSVARIAARREGSDAATVLAALERSFDVEGRALMVAVFEGERIGFGRTHRLTPPPDAPPNCIPAGWYLGGLVVQPEFRRRGVGLELMRQRLDRAFMHAATVYYFATAINGPTIALHARFGFREIARDIWAPGASFTGGVGVLFELARADHRAAGPAGTAR